MGMYCACGIKMRDSWKCKCDWEGWFLCFRNDHVDDAFPKDIPIKEIPDTDGKYHVRVFEDGDYNETISEFSLTKKNWGEFTNLAVSHWEIEYRDGWCGFKGVYAWKHRKIIGK